MAKPLLRWAGSKKKLVPILREFWRPDFDRYIEPFAGSACLFFDIQPRKAVLGDINSDLISTYKVVKKFPDEVVAELKKFKPGSSKYYKVRGLDNSSGGKVEKAARFIYLNRYSFNGIYRTNQKGKFNVPYGGDQNFIPSENLFAECSNALKKARLVSGHFQKTLAMVRTGDFVYIDPPFSVENQRIFTEYNPAKFGMADILSLRSWLVELERKSINFLVSYAESPEADLLKKGFRWDLVKVRRSVAGYTKSRKLVNELLIFNT